MKRLLLFILFISIIFSGYALYQSRSLSNKKSITQGTITVYLKVTGRESFIKHEFTKGKTALDLTRKKEDIVTKGDGANAYVIGINGMKADNTKKEFWAFYVNGKKAEVGTGSYILKEGDKIEWKIEKY